MCGMHVIFFSVRVAFTYIVKLKLQATVGGNSIPQAYGTSNPDLPSRMV